MKKLLKVTRNSLQSRRRGFVYDTPVECYYEVWLVNHSSEFYILVPSDFNLDDTVIYAFSKNLKALEEYARGVEGKKFSAFR